jgi:hypothetical protein
MARRAPDQTIHRRHSQVTGSGWRHTLGDCSDDNWRGLSSPRLLCLAHPLAELHQLQELGFEIRFHFSEDFEPQIGQR